ncbi:MAG: phosphoglycerate kinase [Alphaproteobacteria bacterium]|nr:phosphoglycerate kinase [Alphaproteobacteria bacterium]
MAVPTLDGFDAAGLTVLLRADLNVPMQDGRVGDRTRIERTLPTIRELAGQGARVVVLSHLGRPGGRPAAELSLRPVAAALADALEAPVAFAADDPAAVIAGLPAGGVALLENLRFDPGEEANDPDYAARLAALGDAYVNDAFSAAHRAHASTEALARLLPAAAGRLMQQELEALEATLNAPERPSGAIVGGAKVSTKLTLLGNLVARVDMLAIGGGMANTFLHALGYEMGRSLCERDMAEMARHVLDDAERCGCTVVLPEDAVVAPALEAGAPTEVVPVDEVPPDAMILDIGPESTAGLIDRLGLLRSLVWNGPLGAFEVPPFDQGTNQVAQAAVGMKGLLTVAGGGDTVAALARAGVVEQFGYVSTAGGAFLEWMEGRVLPGVAALEAAA